MTKRNQLAILFSIISILLLVAVIVISSQDASREQNPNTNQTINTGNLNEDVNTNQNQTTDTNTSTENDTVETQLTPGTYTEYSKDKLTSDTNIIFFAAGWCPSCAELDANLSSSDIPDGYTILKTDYDNSQELRVKYGVTTQHTLVQVDSNGELIKKVNGLYNVFTIDDIVQEFN